MGGAALQARRAHLPQMRPPHGAAQGHIIYACISLVLGSDISNASMMSISRGGYHEACGDKSSHMIFMPEALHTSTTTLRILHILVQSRQAWEDIKSLSFNT